jgi:hypothetical protein
VEVDLRPPMGGCMMVFIAVATVGVYPLLRWLIERRYIHRMDDEGFVTRAGTRVRWGEITHIRHISREMDGRIMSDEYDVRSARGRSCLPLSRTGNVREVLDYFIQRVPQEAWVRD